VAVEKPDIGADTNDLMVVSIVSCTALNQQPSAPADCSLGHLHSRLESYPFAVVFILFMRFVGSKLIRKKHTSFFGMLLDFFEQGLGSNMINNSGKDFSLPLQHAENLYFSFSSTLILLGLYNQANEVLCLENT
jgi:hypothetical protein